MPLGIGVVHEEGELRAYGAGLQTLIDYPEFRADLGRRCRARAVERYSLASNLDRLLAIYQDLRGEVSAAAVS